MIEFKKMTSGEFGVYRTLFISDFADNVRLAYQLSEEEARRFAERTFDSNLTEGLSTPGHFIFRIFDQNQDLGYLWYLEKEGEVFIMDLVIDEPYRNRGHGTKTLEKLEKQARTKGMKKLSLYVFSFNENALRLYKKLRFKPVRLYMEKILRVTQ